MGSDNNTALTSSQVVNIEDLRRMAHRRLPRVIFDYLDTQSGSRPRSGGTDSRTGPQSRNCSANILRRRERTFYGMINEGARALEEGMALRSADIDVVYQNAYGFPASRGGPMFYADTVGLPKIYERVCQFYGEHGERWRPSELLRNLAQAGRTFREFDAGRVG
jgi:3-hydroxyacyl-CoA dehydrogenase-like protein